MTETPCRSCGSSAVIPDAVVNDQNRVSWAPLEVTVRLARPVPVEGLAFLGAQRETMTAPLAARLCGECGALDLYAPNAAALWAAYRG